MAALSSQFDGFEHQGVHVYSRRGFLGGGPHTNKEIDFHSPGTGLSYRQMDIVVDLKNSKQGEKLRKHWVHEGEGDDKRLVPRERDVMELQANFPAGPGGAKRHLVGWIDHALQQGGMAKDGKMHLHIDKYNEIKNHFAKSWVPSGVGKGSSNLINHPQDF